MKTLTISNSIISLLDHHLILKPQKTQAHIGILDQTHGSLLKITKTNKVLLKIVRFLVLMERNALVRINLLILNLIGISLLIRNPPSKLSPNKPLNINLVPILAYPHLRTGRIPSS
jgi:hypothetical protein